MKSNRKNLLLILQCLMAEIVNQVFPNIQQNLWVITTSNKLARDCQSLPFFFALRIYTGTVAQGLKNLNVEML